jgi:hypothetical protein
MNSLRQCWTSSTRSKDTLTVRRVFGDAYEVGGTTIIPSPWFRAPVVPAVANRQPRETPHLRAVAIGFAVKARPVGLCIVNEGRVSWQPTVDRTRVILAGQVIGLIAILALRRLFFASITRQECLARVRKASERDRIELRRKPRRREEPRNRRRRGTERSKVARDVRCSVISSRTIASPGANTGEDGRECRSSGPGPSKSCARGRRSHPVLRFEHGLESARHHG